MRGGVASDAGHAQCHRVGALGDAPSHGAHFIQSRRVEPKKRRQAWTVSLHRAGWYPDDIHVLGISRFRRFFGPGSASAYR
jgi:hypothetical protein